MYLIFIILFKFFLRIINLIMIIIYNCSQMVGIFLLNQVALITSQFSYNVTLYFFEHYTIKKHVYVINL